MPPHYELDLALHWNIHGPAMSNKAPLGVEVTVAGQPYAAYAEPEVAEVLWAVADDGIAVVDERAVEFEQTPAEPCGRIP